MNHPSRKCQVHFLGLISYQQAWDLQAQLAEEIAAGDRSPTLLLLEHPHTYTFGRSGHRKNLLWDQAEREQRGIQLFDVDRGGDITYHGPGQLVGYPLLPLGVADADGHLPGPDYLAYLRQLEQVLIDALKEYGIGGQRVEGLTGVWVHEETASNNQKLAKIAAIGVKVDVHGVSRHGFALNVSPDMSYWQGIVPCGLADSHVASMTQWLSPAPPVEDVAQTVAAHFGRIFAVELVWRHLSQIAT
ncbi:MAG: lipoyl(octanoyl) transferase LipB [Anaerolineales bacterium]